MIKTKNEKRGNLSLGIKQSNNFLMMIEHS